MTLCSNRNSQQYYHHWSPSVQLLLLLLLLILVVVFAQIPDDVRSNGGAAGAAGAAAAATTEFSNDAIMGFESSSISHDDGNDNDMDNKQPPGLCISSSTSSSSSWLGSTSGYHALSEQDVHDIRTIGGPRAHVYGEMTPRGFRDFASYVNLTTTHGHDEVFVDLGSGVGSLVIQAAVEFGVKRSIGVELSVARHEAAVQSYQKLMMMMQSPSTTTTRDNYKDTVTFVQGDAASGQVVGRFLAEATVVWISNLLFDDALNRALVNVIEQYAGPNLRVIASLKPIGVRRRSTTTTTGKGDDIIKGFELLPFKVPFEMSWTAGIHNNQHDEYHHQSLNNNGSQQQQQQDWSPSSSSSSSSSSGHFCSILLRRQ